jgi:Outer membrane protein beta-barrel domain
MKKLFLFIILCFAGFYAYSQENMVIVSGGYSFASIENSGPKVPGWRINGSYEFNPSEGPWAFGIAIGYMGLSTTETIAGSSTADYNIGTVPIYFAPKFLFGSDKIKGFIKGAIGTQNSHFKRTALTEITSQDWGFYGGGSAGVKITLSEMFFLSAEYELAWLSNTNYKDGLMNSAMLGIGVKF